RIVEELQAIRIRLALNAKASGDKTGIGRAGAGEIRTPGQTLSARQKRKGRETDRQGRLAPFRHLEGMPGKAKPCDIRGCMSARCQHRISPQIIQLNHTGAGGLKNVLWASAIAVGRRYESGPERLG